MYTIVTLMWILCFRNLRVWVSVHDASTISQLQAEICGASSVESVHVQGTQSRDVFFFSGWQKISHNKALICSEETSVIYRNPYIYTYDLHVWFVAGI